MHSLIVVDKIFIDLQLMIGSGSLAAMATFEDQFKPDMTVS